MYEVKLKLLLPMEQKKFVVRTGIGQDSHRFLPADSSKPCILAGAIFDDVPGFNANSDGDVMYHAICNAISSSLMCSSWGPLLTTSV